MMRKMRKYYHFLLNTRVDGNKYCIFNAYFIYFRRQIHMQIDNSKIRHKIHFDTQADNNCNIYYVVKQPDPAILKSKQTTTTFQL